MGCTPSPLARQILAEATAIAPGRNRATDGICGDAAHQARASYHNTGDAADTTDDPAGGFAADKWAEIVRARCEAGTERRVDQIIAEGRIATSARQWGPVGRRWQWRRYTGPNAHRTHVHYSLNTRNGGAQFFVGAADQGDEFDMATIEELKNLLGEWEKDTRAELRKVVDGQTDQIDRYTVWSMRRDLKADGLTDKQADAKIVKVLGKSKLPAR